MDWSYIAGFFDGEGNFHLLKVKNSFQIQGRMYGDCLDLFKEMVEFMGFGQIYTKRYSEESMRSDMHQLTISKKEELKEFLKTIIPYLIIKKEHAKFIFKNFDFERGNSNSNFDKDKFYSFIKRKGAERFRKIKSKDILR